MVWKSFIGQLAIASRRKAVTAAFVYAISLIIHFTSPAGDRTKTPQHSAQSTNSLELRNNIVHVGLSTRDR
jgi:hypothetical protein